MAALLAFLLVVNLVSLLAFRADKQAAQRGRPRLPEARLLGLAALGGTPGAFTARLLWRHKTRKQPFTARLHAIAAAQLALAAAAAWRFA